MFRSIGIQELLIVLAIILLLFGPKQIPKLAKMFGKAAKDLKDGFEGGEEEAAPKQAIPSAPVESTEAEAKKEESAS